MPSHDPLQPAPSSKSARTMAPDIFMNLEAIIHGSPIPQFVIDKQHRVVYWNKALEEYTGIKAADIIGTNLHWKAFYSEERPCMADLLVDLKLDAIPLWYHGKYNRSKFVEDAFEDVDFFPSLGQDGKWLYFTAVAIKDAQGRVVGAVETLEDITDRKRAEEALQKSEEKYRKIIETAQEGVWVLDAEERTTYINQRMADMLGREPADVLGGSFFDFLDDAVREEAKHNFEKRKQGIVEQHDFKFRHQNGAEVWTIVSTTSLIDSQGNFSGTLVMVTDITERKRAEVAHRLFLEKMQQTQKLESLGVLAGGIAHDFNNLLMIILGHASLALQELPPESPWQTRFQKIKTAALRAAGLTTQMLAYAGRGSFMVQPVNLSRLAEEMGHLLKIAISKKVVLRYLLEPNLPDIQAEPSQLRQIIMNLITNASEAIGDNMGVITLRTGLVEADRGFLDGTQLGEHLQAGRYVLLEVEDTGSGMPPDILQKIFDPFFTTKFTGRGLGLAAVLGIIRGHGGAIKVASEPGQGSVISILFPVPDGSQRVFEMPVETIENWRGHGTIMVVDDEKGVRSVVEMMLSDRGFRIICAKDGQEAIHLFHEHASEIVGVILDLTMPHLDGLETFRELQKIRPGLPVILSSGYSEKESFSRFTEEGFTGLVFIQKPYSVDDLLLKLRQVLRQ